MRIGGEASSAAVDAGSPALTTWPSCSAVRFFCAHRLISRVASPSTSVVRASERSPWSVASPMDLLQPEGLVLERVVELVRVRDLLDRPDGAGRGHDVHLLRRVVVQADRLAREQVQVQLRQRGVLRDQEELLVQPVGRGHEVGRVGRRDRLAEERAQAGRVEHVALDGRGGGQARAAARPGPRSACTARRSRRSRREAATRWRRRSHRSRRRPRASRTDRRRTMSWVRARQTRRRWPTRRARPWGWRRAMPSGRVRHTPRPGGPRSVRPRPRIGAGETVIAGFCHGARRGPRSRRRMFRFLTVPRLTPESPGWLWFFPEHPLRFHPPSLGTGDANWAGISGPSLFRRGRERSRRAVGPGTSRLCKNRAHGAHLVRTHLHPAARPGRRRRQRSLPLHRRADRPRDHGRRRHVQPPRRRPARQEAGQDVARRRHRHPHQPRAGVRAGRPGRVRGPRRPRHGRPDLPGRRAGRGARPADGVRDGAGRRSTRSTSATSATS